ncbi:RnfABCDGE type electron transport complex subunit B [Candidatus Parabeggiatoa sp. HSG14]|uniref:RnfABCDGE type electron transport complex subunit B n=1 Tax=Candidatus Parabeggiatoa sp. HSG14 TaxID=3055593 RepID=UPI0025A7115D|nr:RnfABCDGE type electron transport complex subunit B [Thiotrichales bacterium HSG14]
MTPLLTIVIAGLFMAGLGVLLAIVLAIANKKLFVHEDPRIDVVDEMLPHAQCGACGTPGCRPFAEALVAKKMDPGLCTVNSTEMTYAIANFLGVKVGKHIKRVARLACAGGSHVAYMRARYKGLETCRAAALVSGGGKGCAWGCLGFGDCKDVCGFEAIHMDKFGLPVVTEDKCTACNDCVEVCPKDLFSLQPITHKLWVACKSLDFGDKAEADCEVGCTTCGRCVADAPEGLITLKKNLAVIDYSKNDLASKIAIERCPTGAIVWLDKKKTVKGLDAKKVIRMEPLPRG